MRYVSIIAVLVTTNAWGQSIVGPNGVDSLGLGVDGTGVLIGSVDLGRSGKFLYDSNANSSSNTIPAGVYFQNDSGMSPPNTHIVDEHATWVAQQMIGLGSPDGVSPGAALHSLGLAALDDDSLFALGLNRLALLSSGQVKSIVIPLSLTWNGLEAPDGSSYATRFVDWSARQHDVLYVKSWGNSESDDVRKPTDNYNGIVVASSEVVTSGAYRRFSINVNYPENDTSDAQRIDILAPGRNVPVLNWDETQGTQNGSSFAAPMVTGTVALLQQYVEREFNRPNPRFTVGFRHEVMKAVILNSADKLNNVHGSTREVLNGQNENWTQSPAFTSNTIALDPQMGAGHLNAKRAVQQISPGEYNPGTVPRIGWDFNTIGGGGARNEYEFGANISGYIAVTLAWDRIVEHTGGGTFNEGDQFFPDVLADDTNDLDLYLMLANSNDLEDAITSSVGVDDTIEHIFFNIPSSGAYKIVVENHPVNGLGGSGVYGLAWWNGNFPLAQGDYDGDGDVDSGDYGRWESDFGSAVAAGTGADGNADGMVNAAEYVVWRKLDAIAGSGGSVPEPATTSAFAVLVTLVSIFGRVKRNE